MATRHSWIGLGVLFTIAVFNYVDRTIIAILQEDLRTDLGLSDTQLGALTGLSFALLYTTLALPIARLADRMNRKVLISIALAVWSAATAACGVANNFATLVAFRMGVALGEAGCVPASHSMLADYFPPRQRGTALALWGLSNPLGLLLGFGFGGWVVHALGWREAFLVFGLTGVALAPIAFLVMREPKRGRFESPVAGTAESAQVLPLKKALSILWESRAFRCLAAGGAAHAYVLFVIHNWSSPYYERVLGFAKIDVGLYLALAFGIGGGIGQFFGGFLADRLALRDKRWLMWLPALASGLLLPFGLLQFLAANPALAMAAGVASATLLTVFFAPIVATAQFLVPPQMRAFTSAMLVLTVNIFGLSLGPILTGVVSDTLRPTMGIDSLRYAIAVMLPVTILAMLLFLRAAHHLKTEMPDLRAMPAHTDRG
jgi:predicted MFS family arabinose efflux permease